MNIHRMTNTLLVAYALLALYAVASVFADLSYQPVLTPISSLLAFSFAVIHSYLRLGWKYALLLLAITFTVSLAFESIGVATGEIYGGYHYTDKLGAKFLGLVPWIIPISWFMMSYPSFILAYRILPAMQNLWVWRLSFAALGAMIMTAWDLAMDPMMVASEHWVWDQPGAYFNIPVQNFGGWWLTIFVVFLLFLALARITPAILATSQPEFDQLAVLSYVITGGSSILVDFQVGLAGPGLVGLFAMLPWAILGWWKQRTV